LARIFALDYGMPRDRLPYVRRAADPRDQNVSWMLASAGALPIFSLQGFRTPHPLPVFAERGDSCQVHRPGGEE
jgi:hypothetical protein